MPDIPDIISAVTRYSMLQPGMTVLVAFSGGPDSTTLLHALHACAHELGITLHAAHFNHCLRGEASDADASFAADFARSLGVPIHTKRANQFAGREHVSEEEARTARHAFLQRTAEDIGADRIATGHTADDRAESVLLNVIRGTGISGLGSIRPIQDSTIRPLIDATRQDVESYLSARGIPCRTDDSNADTSYSRNWVRHELIPLLEKRLNTNARTALGRLAAMAADESDLLKELARAESMRARYASSLDAELLLLLPQALLREVIRQEIRHVKADLTDVTYDQIEDIIHELASGADFTRTLTTGGIYASRAGSSFRIHGKRVRRKQEPFEIELAVPGTTLIEPVSARIHAEIVESPEPTRTDPDTVIFDVDSAAGRLRARNARPGDRIRPFGMSGSKKLQDVFVDKKIPVKDRDRAVVVTDDEKIIWVAGVTASDTCRVTAQTKRAIRLRAEIDR